METYIWDSPVYRWYTMPKKKKRERERDENESPRTDLEDAYIAI